MKFLADVNVIFSLLIKTHPLHQASKQWWGSRTRGQVALHLIVKLGVLRLLSNKQVMEGEPRTTKDALRAWKSLENDPRSFMVYTPPKDLEVFLLKNVEKRQPHQNLWTDAYLAAYAEAAGWTMTTFDKGFTKFHLTNLEVLTP